MPDAKGENTIKELMAAFSTLERPVTVVEYKAFWESLSDQEKVFYKTAKL